MDPTASLQQWFYPDMPYSIWNCVYSQPAFCHFDFYNPLFSNQRFQTILCCQSFEPLCGICFGLCQHSYRHCAISSCLSCFLAIYLAVERRSWSIGLDYKTHLYMPFDCSSLSSSCWLICQLIVPSYAGTQTMVFLFLWHSLMHLLWNLIAAYLVCFLVSNHMGNWLRQFWFVLWNFQNIDCVDHLLSSCGVHWFCNSEF